jgi:hypothetical protein
MGLFQECLFLGAVFSTFGPIFHQFSQFRGFLDPIFPVFVIFRSWAHGILARKIAPCTIAHRKTLLKRANWAPQLAVFIFVYLELKPLVSLGPIVGEYGREVFTELVGPTPRTHWSSAKRGGLDTLFTSFFTLFWVAKCLNSRPQSWLNHKKPHEISILVTPGVLGFALKWLCRTY